MIRILLDEFGDAHKDIFLKIDAIPTFIQVADTYFLLDLFEKATKEEALLEYLYYFKDRIKELKSDEIFIPFDFSDQYIGGLFISMEKKLLVKIEYGWTKEIECFGMALNSIENQAKEHRKDFQIDREWLLSKESVLEGLTWSTEKIKKLSPASKDR